MGCKRMNAVVKWLKMFAVCSIPLHVTISRHFRNLASLRYDDGWELSRTSAVEDVILEYLRTARLGRRCSFRCLPIYSVNGHGCGVLCRLHDVNIHTLGYRQKSEVRHMTSFEKRWTFQCCVKGVTSQWLHRIRHK